MFSWSFVIRHGSVVRRCAELIGAIFICCRNAAITDCERFCLDVFNTLERLFCHLGNVCFVIVRIRLTQSDYLNVLCYKCYFRNTPLENLKIITTILKEQIKKDPSLFRIFHVILHFIISIRGNFLHMKEISNDDS